MVPWRRSWPQGLCSRDQGVSGGPGDSIGLGQHLNEISLRWGRLGDRDRCALRRGEVFTTGCWHYRLSRAVHSSQMTGALSRQLAELDLERQLRILAALDSLPDEVGPLSLRDLVPLMRALHVSRPLNMLSAEALAAALVLDAEIVVSTDNPMLQGGAEDLGISYRIRAR